MKRKAYFLKKTALFLALLLLFQSVFPTAAMALTGGPSQPEVRGFQSIGASNMVDLFTGDFSYNIPLMDVDGYPLNLAYSSNPTMDEEASWVGLGWSLNPGTLNRNLRGLPDDFKEDLITRDYNTRDDITIGTTGGIGVEFFGLGPLGLKGGLFYNNHNGFGLEKGVSTTFGVEKSQGGSALQTLGISASINFNSQNGLSVSKGFGLYEINEEKERGYRSIANIGFNSRRGLKDLTVGIPINLTLGKEGGERTHKGLISGRFSFGDFTYTPTPSMPIVTQSFTFHGSVGGAVFGSHPNLNTSAYFTRQYLLGNRQIRGAYGYLHSEEAQKKTTVLMDYNKEKVARVQKEIPVLPIPFGTYDLFSASGQGLSGQFRAIRNDIGIYKEPVKGNYSVSDEYGIEIGGGAIAHFGADIDETITSSNSYTWEDRNNISDQIPFTKKDKLYESVYFKSEGEKIISDPEFYNSIGGKDPIKVKINRSSDNMIAESIFERERNLQKINDIPVLGIQQRAKDQREKRNQVFSYLTAAHADVVGLDRKIKSYPINTLVNCNANNYQEIDRITDERKAHHISEISITQDGGSRYIYGIPAYNYKQKDASFNVSPNPDANGQLVTYNSEDASIDNNKGRDHYYDAQELPAYAHSYLLTGVLSPDYVDVTSDGITEDDLGTAVKLNYSMLYGKEAANTTYNWRVPLEQNKARYQEGFKAKNDDDKGSYIYGEKEIWYVHSIESKTMVAQFYLNAGDDRADGKGVVGENGGINNNAKLKRLEKIELYSKSALHDPNIDAVPIKTVHFEYHSPTNELCQNSPNSSSGKLTLKEIYFTYGDSERGKLNAYKFNYSNNNPDYNIEKYDRWGTYKNLDDVNSFDNLNYPAPANFPSNVDFPYTLQDSLATNSFVDAWNLTSIELPSGGTIKVEYESDDYAYVQDHRAGQMLFVKGFSNDPNTTSPSQDLYYYDGLNKITRNYLIVKLPVPVSSLNELQQRYFQDVDKLYFKSMVSLKRDNEWEYITGYMDYKKTDVNVRDMDQDGIFEEMAIPVQTIGNDIHPITKVAFQNMRLNFPELAYPGFIDNAPGFVDFIMFLLASINEIANAIIGFDNTSSMKKWARKTQANKTWIRVAQADYKKLGGGSRVKRIAIADNWKTLNPYGDAISTYGQEYFYETERTTLNGNQETISSGVAAYEPMLGNEENLMRKPLPYEDDVHLAPDNSYYIETPIGESLFPSPTIGYSKVRVESFGTYGADTQKGVGYSLNEFYTAKDFPTRTDRTYPTRKRFSSDPITKFFSINVKDYLSMSQGFVIELNDMHGKAKREAIYNDVDALISSSEYFYKVEDEDASIKQLNNEVRTFDKESNVYEDVNIGLNVDIWQEMTEEKTKSETVGIRGNGDGFLAFIFPVLIAVPLPKYALSKKRFQSTVTTKLIKRCGLIDRVKVIENGSSITTKNLVYDKETGAVLVSETQNEFDDPMYQVTYPAHWVYEGMGQAYKNIGFVSDWMDINNGHFPTTFDPWEYFVPGDEVFVEVINSSSSSSGTNEIQGPFYIVETAPNTLSVLSSLGIPLNVFSYNFLTYRLLINRSGRRNQANVPVANVTTQAFPINAGQLVVDDMVINASAVEFKDDWQNYCRTELAAGECDTETLTQWRDNINPYTNGVKGNWRPYKSYAYNARRTPGDLTANQVNIRASGYYESYDDFWQYMNGAWQANNTSDKWIQANEVTLYDIRGNELENKDAIGNYSAAYFGYLNTRVTAIASNSQRKEMTYDGFEDYFFVDDCSSEPFPRYSLYDANQHTLSDRYSHTGKYALELPANYHHRHVVQLENDPECVIDPVANFNESAANDMGNYSGDGNRAISDCDACIPGLELKKGKRYFMTLWRATKESIDCGRMTSGISAAILFDGGGVPVSVVADGLVIDGWQRMSASFTIPSDATTFMIDLANRTGDVAYIDDFRVHPNNSNMVSYVYDPCSLRLMAQLDDNNYASFYEYDDEGILVRTKRETERGIVTIQEARTVLKPNN